VYPIPNLLALVDHLTGHACLSPYQSDLSLGDPDDLPAYAADFRDVKGQEHVKSSKRGGRSTASPR
jgi:predicted ATPase with chaperone activity